jgi:cobalt-precorrin 5A hydrolase
VKIALIALSKEGGRIAALLANHFDHADRYLHGRVIGQNKSHSFQSIKKLSRDIFKNCEGLIYIAPCGVVVRSIAPLLEHKTTDPAVIVVDAGGRFVVSLLSGHEGGANALALEVANILGAEPIISTTTEALKNLIVGVGCRAGTDAKAITEAVQESLGKVGASLSEVRMLASADIKMHEKGLIAAAASLGLGLRFISSKEIASTTKKFQRSKFVAARVHLPAVAEPAALLAGRRTQLILPKTIFHGITVAIAQEDCL